MRLKSQLNITAEKFDGEQNLSPIHIPTMSKDRDKQFELAQRSVDIFDCPKRKICVSMQRYKTDKPQRFCSQVRFYKQSRKERNIIQLSM